MLGPNRQRTDGLCAECDEPLADANTAARAGSVTFGRAGTSHVCVISAGTVKCWGTNGSVSSETVDDRFLAAVTVMGSSGTWDSRLLVQPGAAITNGALICWGANGAGQLGDGTKADKDAPITVAVAGDASRGVRRCSSHVRDHHRGSCVLRGAKPVASSAWATCWNDSHPSA